MLPLPFYVQCKHTDCTDFIPYCQASRLYNVFCAFSSLATLTLSTIMLYMLQTEWPNSNPNACPDRAKQNFNPFLPQIAASLTAPRLPSSLLGGPGGCLHNSQFNCLQTLLYQSGLARPLEVKHSGTHYTSLEVHSSLLNHHIIARSWYAQKCHLDSVTSHGALNSNPSCLCNQSVPAWKYAQSQHVKAVVLAIATASI